MREAARDGPERCQDRESQDADWRKRHPGPRRPLLTHREEQGPETW